MTMRTLACCRSRRAVAVLRADVPQPPARSGQTFRTGTDVVMVDVSVRDRGKAVTGLTAQDFVLTDNGVRQQIDSVEATAVPIDLTLVVDVSGNPRTAWTTPVTPAALGETVRAEVAPIASLLRPTDRMRVFANDTYVQHLVPMGHVVSVTAAARRGGRVVESLRYVDRRASSARRTRAASRRCRAHERARHDQLRRRCRGARGRGAIGRVVSRRSDGNGVRQRSGAGGISVREHGILLAQSHALGTTPQSARRTAPRPSAASRRAGLEAGAQATGGALHKARLLSEPTLAGTFKKAFEDFRSSYVLRYTLKGVPPGGWHTIEVTLPRADPFVSGSSRCSGSGS